MTVRGILYLVKMVFTGGARIVAHRIRMKMLGIDLRSVSLAQLGLPPERCRKHANSGGPQLDAILNALPISPQDSVIDVGCGKGGAILTMVKHPFRRVDGLEISTALAQVARENFRRMGIRNSEVFVCDAAEFVSYDAYNFVYLYNPFPALVMKQMLANLANSAVRAPRSITLIYNNPVCDDLVRERGFLPQREFRDSELPVRVYTLTSLAD